jgi:hypothetical protein
MSRRPSWNIDPATGKPVMVSPGRARRPAPAPILGGGGGLPASAFAAQPSGPPPLELLVPALIQRGAVPQLSIGWTPEGRVCFTAQLGPIHIPVAFDLDVFDGQVQVAIDHSRDMAAGLLEGQGAPAEPPADCEDLLAEAQAAVARPEPEAAPKSSIILLPGSCGD